MGLIMKARKKWLKLKIRNYGLISLEIELVIKIIIQYLVNNF
jgi:hypothetical protein